MSSEPVDTFKICFWYFISFNMKSFFLKIFKMNQTEVAPNMEVFPSVTSPVLKNTIFDLEKTTT